MNRAAFLDRIALRLGRPRRSVAEARAEVGVIDVYRTNPLGAGGEQSLVRRFATELDRVGGKFVSSTRERASAALELIVRETSSRALVAWDAEEFAELGLARWITDQCRTRANFVHSDRAAIRDDDARAFITACAGADLGITSVDWAVANTGSVCFGARRARPRSVSLLPSVHLAIVPATRIVARLGLALEPERGDVTRTAESRAGEASQWLCITGPSRTSDIENDLTIGVHGPGALIALVIEDA